MAVMPRSQTCKPSPHRGREDSGDSHRDPGRAPRSQSRFHSGRDQRPEEFYIEILSIVEIDAHERQHGRVRPRQRRRRLPRARRAVPRRRSRAYSQTWGAITELQAAYNRHQMPPMTEDSVDIDHRRGRTFAPGEGTASSGQLGRCPKPQGSHRVCASAERSWSGRHGGRAGTSQEGFDFEWREIGLFTVCWRPRLPAELFDEADLDAALVRFDEVCGKTQVR